jgi:serine/threonine protein phosphatase PrpC
MIPFHHEFNAIGKVEFEPEPVEMVVERRKTRDYLAHLDNGLVCLRCSTVNKSDAAQCIQCHALLNTPSEVYRLSATGSAQSSIGQSRTINEDEVGLWGRGGVLIAVVADGMGGAAAGEEASRFVREAVQASFAGVANGSETLEELSESEVALRLRSAILLANHAIMERIRRDESVRGMGTTATLAFVRGNRAVLAHVGDSRAYVINQDGITRVTDDHSFVEVLVASGHITRRQAAIHPMRSVLYRALGHTLTEDVDIYHINLNAGDRLILCSDGLIRHMLNAEISVIALRSDDPSEISYELIELANQRGGEDNISVATVVVNHDTRPTPIETLAPTPCEMLHLNGDADKRRTTKQVPSLVLDEDED